MASLGPYSTPFAGVSLPNGNVFAYLLLPFLRGILMRQGWIYHKKVWNGTGEHLHERKSWHGASITLSLGGGIGTPTILGTDATLQLKPLRLHEDNLECRAQKWAACCQKCSVPCQCFSACKWGLYPISIFVYERKLVSM